jgi:hypothetical protein
LLFSDTGCADENHNPVSETSCLRSLAAETVIRALPWQQWQNDHFYRIPTSDETSVIIVTVDGGFLSYILS